MELEKGWKIGFPENLFHGNFSSSNFLSKNLLPTFQTRKELENLAHVASIHCLCLLTLTHYSEYSVQMYSLVAHQSDQLPRSVIPKKTTTIVVKYPNARTNVYS